MTALTITRHGETRMSQRGIREIDLDVLLAHGTEIGRGRIMLKKRDAAKVIQNLKKQIANIERLTDKVLVVTGGHLITAYHQESPIRPSGRGTRKPSTHQICDLSLPETQPIR